ncbi:MAG: sulfatase [candidate division KSB1 bacterium]|nr:sulfatase [candidate division KSB1 bacterium]
MPNKPPNILLISIDSLRSDRLSCYGCARETSPNLDLLAREGVAFDNTFTAANWTGASLASLLTGLYPTVHGYTNKYYYLDPEFITLPQILREHGYQTLSFSNNMYVSSRTGLDKGFDTFLYQGKPESQPGDHSSGESDWYRTLRDAVPMRARFYIKDWLDQSNKRRMLTRDDGACATESAFLQQIGARQPDRPFFAYIHYQEPHSIYFPPYPYRRRFFSGSHWKEGAYLKFDHMGYFAGHVGFSETDVRHYLELYDGEIAYLDWRLGRLFDWLRRQNLWDDTVVMVTSDHGENMGEKGYFWHAFCLYDKLIRVPLIVRYPDWFRINERSAALTQTVDIVPTLLDGLGIDWPYSRDCQGQSFLSGALRTAVLTETYNPELMVDRWLNRRKDLTKEEFRHYLRDLRAYQTTNHKLIRASDGDHEFFDMNADRAESVNRYTSDAPYVQQCESGLQSWMDAFTPHVAKSTHFGFDKEIWNQMRELGYA